MCLVIKIYFYFWFWLIYVDEVIICMNFYCEFVFLVCFVLVCSYFVKYVLDIYVYSLNS